MQLADEVAAFKYELRYRLTFAENYGGGTACKPLSSDNRGFLRGRGRGPPELRLPTLRRHSDPQNNPGCRGRANTHSSYSSPRVLSATLCRSPRVLSADEWSAIGEPQPMCHTGAETAPGGAMACGSISDTIASHSQIMPLR